MLNSKEFKVHETQNFEFQNQGHCMLVPFGTLMPK